MFLEVTTPSSGKLSNYVSHTDVELKGDRIPARNQIGNKIKHFFAIIINELC